MSNYHLLHILLLRSLLFHVLLVPDLLVQDLLFHSPMLQDLLLRDLVLYDTLLQNLTMQHKVMAGGVPGWPGSMSIGPFCQVSIKKTMRAAVV